MFLAQRRATLGLLSLLNGENKLLMPNRSPVKIERPLYEFVVVCYLEYLQRRVHGSHGIIVVRLPERGNGRPVCEDVQAHGIEAMEKMENEWWCVVA